MLSILAFCGVKRNLWLKLRGAEVNLEILL